MGLPDGRRQLVLHAAGWLGGGLTASFEKLVIDAEMLQMMAAYFDPSVVDAEHWRWKRCARSARPGISSAPPHTLRATRRAFYTPLVSNWDNYDTWVERGQRDGAATRPTASGSAWSPIRAAADRSAIDEALKDYMARRKRGA